MKNDEIERRVFQVADHLIKTKQTVRQAATVFGVSKSTIHKDVTERLRILSPASYYRVRDVLDENLAERHIRGGMSTKLKYERMKTDDNQD